MGNVGVFPWRIAMMGRASRANGAVVLPFPFSLSPALWHKARSQWKREEHRGGVDWIETFLMSPAPYTFSHIGRNFNRPPRAPPKKKIFMPPVYILANPIISQILIFVTSHFSYPGYFSLHLTPHLRFFSVPTHVNEVVWGGRVFCNLILRGDKTIPWLAALGLRGPKHAAMLLTQVESWAWLARDVVICI